MKPFLKYLRPIVQFALMLAMPLTGAMTQNFNDSFVRLTGHVPYETTAESNLFKRLNSNAKINFSFILPLRNQEELEVLISRISDPFDEYYGKYLTTDQFNEKFAPSYEDYEKVVAFAKKQGLDVLPEQKNRMLLNVQSTARAVENIFNIQLSLYEKPNGRKFYAPDYEPEVPSYLAEVISGIVGLDNFVLRKPLFRVPNEDLKLDPHAAAKAFPTGPGGGFAPHDLQVAYNLSGISADGSGQSIALLELASYQASDINAYTDQFGLPRANLVNVQVDGGSQAGINAEVTLDIELALALAPKSTIYVYEGPNSDQGILDTYNKIATDNIAKQISTSWGLGEDLTTSQFLQAENAIFMQMAAQGQSMYAAAGDSGAYDDYSGNNSKNLVVDDPASQPYVTAVGGTTLNVNAQNGAYVSESVWDNGLGSGAGGGGVSKIWPIPAWQKNVSNVYSTANRNVPDVALNADPATGYAIFYNGSWQIFGGTSCAAPLWAAFNALVNEQLVATGQPVLGYVNPLIYGLCTTTAYPTDFHDVTSGNNLFYQAHGGYDNATGWGSFNGSNLWTALTKSTVQQKTPLLNVAMSHTSAFKKGATGAYYIVVTNHGNAPTTGVVTVQVSLPEGLTFNSFSSTGWTFNQSNLTFTRSDLLSPGSHYPPIRVVVNVSSSAPYKVVPSATVSGGGSPPVTVTNPTTT